MVSRTQIIVPSFYQAYIKAVKEPEVVPALESTHERFMKLLKEIPKEKRDYAYAEGKWTIRQLVQHIIDSERVFAFRALWFARKETGPLPGFDEKNWALTLTSDHRKWKQLVREFDAVRRSTICLFSSFNDEQLLRTGISNNNTTSVAAFGFISAGHVAHHIRIIRERYLSMTLEQAL